MNLEELAVMLTVRYTPSGMAVATIALAYEYGRKDQQTGKRPAQWIEITMWGKTAEALSQYLTKGKQVFIEAERRTHPDVR